MLDEDAWFFAPSTLKQLDVSTGSEIPFSGELKVKGSKGELEAVTCATPLGVVSLKREMAKDSDIKEGKDPFAAVANPEAYKRYFWGDVGGCLGETSVFWLLIGAALLFAFRIVRWHVPLSYVGSVALFTWLIHSVSPGTTPGPLFHVLTGGVVLGAFFCATDMVTSPMTGLGGIIFGVGCGIMTCCIRIWGNYPEGVSFSILFMNAFVPLIDRWTVGKPFGYRPPPPKEEKKQG
jgi:electron transport complex protein RnfD